MKRNKLVLIGLLLITIVGFPTLTYLVVTRQNIESSAHVAKPSATAVCKNGDIEITFKDSASFLFGGSVLITVSDTLHLFDGTKKVLTEGQSFTIIKTLNVNSLANGDELIHTSAVFTPSYPTQTNDIPVSAVGPCSTPTPTPTPTVSLTPTVTLTPTPPICSLPSLPSNVKIICPNCKTQ